MMTFLTSSEALKKTADLLRQHRLAKNLTQKDLAARSGVSYAVLRKFENSGKISLESLMKLSLVLGILENILEAIEIKPKQFQSMDELLKEKDKISQKKVRAHAKKL